MANFKIFKVSGALPASPQPNSVYHLKVGSIVTTYVTDSSGTAFITPTLETGYTIFPIWAEESGALTNNNLQWSFGNGATGAISIPVPECEVFALGLDAEVAGTSVSIDLMQNNAAVSTETFTGANGYNILTTPISFSEGDLLGFRTNTEVGAYSDVRVVAWCRIGLLGLRGEKGEAGNDGTNGIPNGYCKINIPPAANINVASTDIQLGTATLDTIGVTINGNEVTLPAGTYETKLILNTSSTVQRPNQSVSLFVNGVLESLENGEGYIRSTGDHNEAKVSHTDIISISGTTINYVTDPIATTGVVALNSGKLLIHKIA